MPQEIRRQHRKDGTGVSKEQVEDSQINWNCQHFQLREQFLQRHENLRDCVAQAENSYVRP